MEQTSPAVLGPVEPTVRPAAWIDASSLRWLKAKPETRSCRTEIFGAQQEGQLPLYDQAGLDAAVAAERERCVRIIEAHQVPVGNSAAGEMAAEWTMDSLREIRDAIRRA